MLVKKSMLLLLLTGTLVVPNAYAGSCISRSGPERAVLLELYTSEGCSSCPVADRWLSKQAPNVFSPAQIVPLAFHVDYWDKLGWKDRFANPDYSARQSAYTKIGGSSFAYTPQVLLDGRDDPQWRNDSDFQAGVSKALHKMPRASLTLQQTSVEKSRLSYIVQAELKSAAHSSSVRVYAALYQNALVSNVLKGENGGSSLQHDFVVRGFMTSQKIGSSGKITVQGSFIPPVDARQEAMGIVVFAQDVESGEVLQVLSAPLCRAASR